MKNWILVLAIIIAVPAFSQERPNLLVFSKTAGYRHEAIPSAMKALAEMGQEQGWSLTFTEDATFFSDEFLKNFQAVLFLMTTEDVLSEDQQGAFERYIQAGGAFVGIHSATNTEYDWPWFGQLIGGYFIGHPPVQDGRLIVENGEHPSTAHFEQDSLDWNDEFYTFDKNPRSEVDVLISIDENSYNVEDNPWFKDVSLVMGDHPLVWCRLYDGGRVFVTSLGHMPELYDDPRFRKHLAGGIIWALDK